jgi:hypothetical protein
MAYDNIKNYDGLLEGVITCVNFSDYLDETLYFNLHHFDRLVVVTTHDDVKTQDVCAKHSIDCVCTDVFHEFGAKFCKGLAINLGLANLRCTGWVVHFDADIILPDNFRNALNGVGLQKDCIYGADRINVVGRSTFEKLKSDPHFRRQFQRRYLVLPAQNVNSQFNTLGARLFHKEFGYTPIGFFQLWYGPSGKKYPTVVNDSAEHTDVVHALQWPRCKRILLPNVIVYHLESEQSKMGQNWRGRKTKPFSLGE